jgi:hypothetical protein
MHYVHNTQLQLLLTSLLKVILSTPVVLPRPRLGLAGATSTPVGFATIRPKVVLDTPTFLTLILSTPVVLPRPRLGLAGATSTPAGSSVLIRPVDLNTPTFFKSLLNLS